MIGLYTAADHTPLGGSLSELRLIHPVVMGHLTGAGGRLRFDAMFNFEGVTIPDGELAPGMFGEGFVDRRHPHTYLHELVVTGSAPGLASGRLAVSGTVGKGFAPFGTDDPMSRPVLRYPVNHHFAQILERLVAIGAVRAGPVVLEAALFNGDEPTAPDDAPSLDRFGDSWAARVTLRPVAGLEAQVSHALVHSPEHVEGAGTDQRKWSASARWDGTLGGSRAVVLAEWARTSEANGTFTYRSWLAEGAWTRGRHRLHYRAERTERPEEERLADPFRVQRPHHDDSNLGTTRWTIHTAGYSVRLPSPDTRMDLAGLLEVSRAQVTRIEGIAIDPETFYGDSTIWTVSVGLRLAIGAGLHRMGRYGVAAEPADPGTHMEHEE